eukprot:3795589-Rhodomonas_salina.2
MLHCANTHRAFVRKGKSCLARNGAVWSPHRLRARSAGLLLLSLELLLHAVGNASALHLRLSLGGPALRLALVAHVRGAWGEVDGFRLASLHRVPCSPTPRSQSRASPRIKQCPDLVDHACVPLHVLVCAVFPVTDMSRSHTAWGLGSGV